MSDEQTRAVEAAIARLITHALAALAGAACVVGLAVAMAKREGRW